MMFAALGCAIVAYGSRGWLPAVASRHGVGIDAMLNYLLWATGILVLAGFFVLAWLVWAGSGRDRVTVRLARYRTELSTAGVVVVLMAAVAEGGVLVIGLPVWQEYFAAEAPSDVLTIEVTAQQFFWHVRYAGADHAFGRTEPRFIDDATNPLGMDRKDASGNDDILLVNRIVVPVNRPVRIRLRARDVIHSFFLPHLRVKQDAVPGMAPEVTFTPTREGTFELACAELCGLGHYRMQGILRVVAASGFERVLAEEAAP
jgi:cytochrome c oxidase subunit 2